MDGWMDGYASKSSSRKTFDLRLEKQIGATKFWLTKQLSNPAPVRIGHGVIHPGIQTAANLSTLQLQHARIYVAVP